MSDIVVGIDPSLRGTGYIALEGGKIVRSKLIESKPSGDKPKDEALRLIGIVTEIADNLVVKVPKLVVIEGLAYMANNTTALMQLAGLNYLLREHLIVMGIPFIIVAPTSLKKFLTGKGNCQKDLMLLESYKRYKIYFTDNNLCDAHSLARIGEACLDATVKLTKPQQEVIGLLKKQYEK